MIPPVDHQLVEIESYEAADGGARGRVQLRPVRGQKFPVSMSVEGNKSLVQDYEVGTRFKIQATLMKRPTGGQYLFTSWQWDVRVIDAPI